MKFNSVDEVLDFAIIEEEKAHDFYMELAKKTKKAWMKKTFEQFAQEEMEHKALLLNVKAGGELKPVEGKILDLKILETLKEEDITNLEEVDYEDALKIAMQKEKEAYLLYMGLAEQVEDANIKNLFLRLAQEEANHKLRFETEYDDYVLRDN